MSDETASVTTPESAPVVETGVGLPEATPAAESPSRPETNWQAAYQTLSKSVNKRDQYNESLLAQNNALVNSVEVLKGDVEVLLKQTIGEDALKVRQAERQSSQERQEALAAANTASQFIPAAIDVMAHMMKTAGVPEADIRQVFMATKDQRDITEWTASTKAGAEAAISKVRASDTSKVAGKDKDEIKAEATALAERTLRAKGIDKVDLGRGQSITPERSFVERLKSIDRNTEAGEAAWQKMRKDVARGTLQT